MKIPEKNKVPINLIARVLNGEASMDEIFMVEQWKNISDDNKKVFNEYAHIWEKSGRLSPLSTINIGDEWKVFLENLRTTRLNKRKSISLRAPLLRVAAALVAGLFLGYSGWALYRAMAFEKVVAKNKVEEISLPDGSLLSLNINSTVTYPKKFKKNRSLVLDGEAFFNVKKDSSSPFIVKSGDILTEVVGTSFNVIAYRKENLVQVFVESGIVAVYKNTGELANKNLVKKGETIIVSREKDNVSLQENADLNYNSWKTGRFIFENSSLQYVVGILEKHFHAEIRLVNPVLNKCQINVNFENKSLEYILETITQTLDLDMVKSDNAYLIDGQGC